MNRDSHAAPLPGLFAVGPMPAVISRVSDNTVVAINVRTAQLFEVAQKDLAGARVSDDYANPIERGQLAERIQRDGRVDNMRIELRRPGGGTFWALASSRLDRRAQRYRHTRSNRSRCQDVFDIQRRGFGCVMKPWIPVRRAGEHAIEHEGTPASRVRQPVRTRPRRQVPVHRASGCGPPPDKGRGATPTDTDPGTGG